MKNIKYDIESICDSLAKYIQVSATETDVISRLESEVRMLLNVDKPKIMVYGIYNAGKSTLINAMCGNAVAEVRDCPTTDSINEYDVGSYILVDSPGVDAPIEHEIVTDDNISKCHVILYVISTKGGFESIKNYQNMYKLIQTGKPFIIVINDKEGDPDLNASCNINSIKCKIIDNLRKVSNNNCIENLFDTVAVNGKRGFSAKTKRNEKLYQLSNIDFLKNRIDRFLDSGKAMRIFIAPINNLISIIDDHIISIQKTINTEKNDELMYYLKHLNQKRIDFISEIPINIDSVIRRYENTLIQTLYNQSGVKWEENIEYLYNEIELLCSKYMEDLTSYFKLKYENIDFSTMFSRFAAVVKREESEAPEIQINDQYVEEEKQKLINNYDSLNNNNLGSNTDIINGVTYDNIKGSPTNIPFELIANMAKKFISTLNNKYIKREQEKLQKLQERIEESNRMSEARANAEARRRQEIRMHVETIMHKMQNELTVDITHQFAELFDNAEECIMYTVNENKQEIQKINESCQQLNDLKSKAMAIKNMIR